MTIKPRSAWGARAPKSGGRITLGTPRLIGVAIHWFGSPRSPSTQAGVPAVLRAVQSFHMGPGGLGVASGGSDIGYSFMVDRWGGIWEGRGWNVRPGATGPANDTHGAIAYAAGFGDTFTPEAQQAIAWLIGEHRRRGAGGVVGWHSQFMTTSCPGDTIRAWIRDRGFEKTPIPKKEDAVYPWLNDWISWYILDRRDETKPKGVPERKIPQDAWDVLGTIVDVIQRNGAHGSFLTYADHWLLARFEGAERPGSAPKPIPAEWWPKIGAVREIADKWAERPKTIRAAQEPLLKQIAELEEELKKARDSGDERLIARIHAAREHTAAALEALDLDGAQA